MVVQPRPLGETTIIGNAEDHINDDDDHVSVQSAKPHTRHALQEQSN